ncbi:MAG: PAS domain-containing protein [Gemmatimonadaceae bacterium]
MKALARNDVMESAAMESDVMESAAAVFAGEGEMRARCRALDWAATPLGPVETWPAELRFVVRTCLESPFPINLWCGAELTLIYNDAYRRVLGAKHPRALGRSGAETWAEIWSEIAPMFARIRAGGSPVYAEDSSFVMQREGAGAGADAWFTFALSAVRDEAGAIVAFLNIAAETTGRVVAEREANVARAAAERAEARLREVFEQAPAFLAVFRGRDHVFEFVNDSYYQLVGHRDLLGRPLLEALPEIRGQGFDEILDGVLATGTPYIGRELRASLARTPGAPLEECFVDLTYAPLTEAGGIRSGVIAHGSDVTRRVLARREVERLLRESEAAQEALRASEARLRDVFEQAPVAVAVMSGPEHVYTIVSPRYAETPGGGRPLLGRTIREAFPELVGQGLVEILDRVYATGEPYFGAERAVMLDHAGAGVAEPHFFNIGYQPLRDAAGAVYAIASASVDVTEQVRARREVELAREAAEAARAEAEEANRAKAEFLATMSHELRTPLNAIGGYAELMAMGIQGPVTPAQAQALARIQTSQRHLLGLINEVLNYTRVEAGVVQYELERVPVAEALATCEALTAPQMRARRLVFRGVAECDPALTVRADREKLQQIMLNLLSNATKFTDPGGAITIRCEPRDDAVAIRVTDTGVGIPAERLEHVFEPFVQVDARLASRQEGVGLGLAISRDLARGMGGDLTVESELGVGSTFMLMLPVG